MKFQINKDYLPMGDQPQAIQKLITGINKGYKHQTLFGVTGSGKTFTIANLIEKTQKPTLVISHNKTLAAQLCQEFRTFFPKNAVEYFVSYYDYYQPEAYIASSDTYIEKETSINDEIDRLRHSATSSILSRKDTIIVSSVSCIYGLGLPEEYKQAILEIKIGNKISRSELISNLINLYYSRSEVLLRGKFRVRGAVFEIVPISEESIYKIELNNDVVSKITRLNLITKSIEKEYQNSESLFIFPAKHFIISDDDLKVAIVEIKKELSRSLKSLNADGKLLEAERLERRTKYDIEMMQELGYCSGIENYSRYFTGRAPGQAPFTLIDYFPNDFLLVVDESHVTMPQIQGMYEGDRSRKISLVENGFRLPSALDNRPLKFNEFEDKINQAVYTTATPAKYELKYSSQIVEQVIRPTGLVDPEIIVKPAVNQVNDAISEIEKEITNSNRVLVTTLTKKMAEDLSKYLREKNIKSEYLHSEVDTIDRIRILQDLRRGKFDVLVGVNLLREGLDLPEVSLVCILDADKEGFLRSRSSLIQTMGRAARHILGRVVLYADNITNSMNEAINETNRRRKIQMEYNKFHRITPKSIIKAISSIAPTEEIAPVDEFTKLMDLEDLPKIIKQKEHELKQLSRDLKFEQAIVLRDEITQLRRMNK